MPTAPLRYCSAPGCSQKVQKGRCTQHQQAQRHEHRRFSEGKYGRPWRRAVAQWIAEDPEVRTLCAQCLLEGRIVMGQETDHIVPHRGDERLFWDRKNWRRLCRAHHSAKTARETGYRPTRGVS